MNYRIVIDPGMVLRSKVDVIRDADTPNEAVNKVLTDLVKVSKGHLNWIGGQISPVKGNPGEWRGHVKLNLKKHDCYVFERPTINVDFEDASQD